MSLTCKLQIALDGISPKKAQSIQSALEPDNVNFPKGLTLEIENIDNSLVFNFESRDTMKSLIATVDEVLKHVQIALEVIK